MLLCRVDTKLQNLRGAYTHLSYTILTALN